jgi:hypothetical protein
MDTDAHRDRVSQAPTTRPHTPSRPFEHNSRQAVPGTFSEEYLGRSMEKKQVWPTGWYMSATLLSLAR